jgi:dTDP-4-dehydrorhamnose reductase
VYATRGRNFFLTIRRLLREKEEVRVVFDQVGAPTPAEALASATGTLLRRHGLASLGEARGTYHVTAAGHTSWHGFATEIARLELPDIPNPPRIAPIASDQYRSPARRPRNSRLSNEKLRRHFDVELPRWEACLEELHGRLKQRARLDGGTPYRR